MCPRVPRTPVFNIHDHTRKSISLGHTSLAATLIELLLIPFLKNEARSEGEFFFYAPAYHHIQPCLLVGAYFPFGRGTVRGKCLARK